MEKEILVESNYRQEQLSRWFLPSLLFHLLIIVLLFMFEQERRKPTADVIFVDDEEQVQQPIPIAPPQIAHLPQPPDEEVPFSLHLPKSSTFGATSLVSEEAQFAGDPQATADQAEPDSTFQEPTAVNPPSQEMQAAAHTQRNLPPREPLSTPPTLASFPPTSVASVMQEALAEPLPETTEQRSPPDDRSPSPTSPQPSPAPEQKRRIKNFWGQTKQSSSPINQKMSLTKLAEGFLDYAKDTHGTAVDINSKDLTLEPTLQKIGWFLQNSFHLHNKPIALNQDVHTSITLHLEIDEKGGLINSFLAPQTNIPSLDRNLLRIAQGAAPFPPIPPHVMRNKKTFNLKIPIEIDAKRGTHEYYFLFRG